LDEFFGLGSSEESSCFDKKIDEPFGKIDPDVWHEEIIEGYWI